MYNLPNIQPNYLVESKRVQYYVECSAINGNGIDVAMESAARIVLATEISKGRKRRKDKCSVM